MNTLRRESKQTSHRRRPVSQMYVDVAAITGVGRVGNSLNKGDAIPSDTEQTQYQTTLPAFTPKNAADAGLAFDLDGDGIPDPMDKEPKDYNQDNRVEEIGFYLNGKQPGQEDAQGNLIPPDVIRRMDTLPDFQHQGLVGRKKPIRDIEAG